ncbi:hypothetical protein BS17DRAFT_767339 [Gyrodon lividus]|nr:hypothetical protein BS17DRAFT_767339 [Gyrodon lividus]
MKRDPGVSSGCSHVTHDGHGRVHSLAVDVNNCGQVAQSDPSSSTFSTASTLNKMRGLPFPTNAIFELETTSEHGTPFSNVEDIPIDPALACDPAIDPAIAGDGNERSDGTQQAQPVVIQEQFAPPRLRYYSQEPLQYDLGPQGDPFAPQQPVAYLPIPEEDVAPVSRPQKRKRKPRREEECGFCQGNDSKNQHGEPEVMVSCEECGRSGHPSCMELGKVADIVRSYCWKCVECKTCEICQEKGDDARILFCDFCDRGWHMDCLLPPLEEEPPGQWHCPRCPPLELFLSDRDSTLAQQETLATEGLHHVESDPKGKGREPSEADSEVDVEVDNDPPTEDDNDDSSSDPSDSDSDDNNMADAPTPRRPQPIKWNKKPPKRTTEPRTPRPAKRMRIRVRSPAPPLIVRLRLPPKGKGKEREDDVERNIFEDLLTPVDRDTSKTNIDSLDRSKFEKSRIAAEEKLYPTPGPPTSATENPDTPVAGPSSRPLRSTALHQLSIPSLLPTPSPAPSTPSLYPSTPAPFPQTPNIPADSDGRLTLRIRTIRFGPYDIHPWYDAPFPEEYANIPDGRLWICDEIYRDGSVSIFEVDGRKNKIYCQNLCLLSKMFLDHKSLFYDVEPFLFYVMTQIDDVGAHFVGYFSKEKCSPKNYNVSCIMTLPVRQRQGWGNYLIDFSYLLSKKEQRTGSPEKPLSGLGALGYRNYWTLALMRYLIIAPPKPTLEDISRATSMTIEDIYNTLVHQSMITVHAAIPSSVRPSPGQSIKFPRGRRNGVARRHSQRPTTQKESEGGGNKSNTPFVAPVRYEISWNQENVEQWLESWAKKGSLKLKPEKLKWTPFVLSRTKAGGEDLQAEVGFGIRVVSGMAQAETPETSLVSGTPIICVSDRVKSSAPGLAASGTERGEEQVPEVLRDVSETPAAHLFDDLLVYKATIPKKQLRSGLKEATSPHSLAHSNREIDLLRPVTLRQTRSVSSRPVVSGDSEVYKAETYTLPGGAVNGVREAEISIPAVPTKRRRGRPPRARPPDVVPVPSLALQTGMSLPPKSTSPRKRRRVNSPIPDDSRPPTNLVDDARHEHVDPPANQQLVNEPGHTTNGLRQGLSASLQLPSAIVSEDWAGLPVGTAGEEKESDHRDRLLDDDLPPQRHPDVKSEDLGTPLTGLTSRHSVPSDDTVFVSDGLSSAVIHSKVLEEVEHIITSPSSPGRHRVDGDIAWGGTARTGVVQFDSFGLFGFDFGTKQPGASSQTSHSKCERFTSGSSWFRTISLEQVNQVMDNSQSHGPPAVQRYSKQCLITFSILFSDAGMPFGHLQRDPSLQTTAVSSAHLSQSLNQALGSHLTPTLSSRPTFHEGAYRLTDSPPTIIDPNGTARSTQVVAGASHSPIHEFTVPMTNDSPAANALKRKHADGANPISNGQVGKRRREGEEMGEFDSDSVHGSKHWTEDEKTKLFTWLMGQGEDEHWSALRTAKNSCFRECAVEVFGGKKTYQALKGCYERNFNLFKQIYAFEGFHALSGSGLVTSINEGDRLREYERRIQLARKGGCDVGNLSARSIDHWHRIGWWNGDPATTRTLTRHNGNASASGGVGCVEEVDDEDNALDMSMSEPPPAAHTRTPSHSRPMSSQHFTGTDHATGEAGASNSPNRLVALNHKPVSPQPEQSPVNLSIPQSLMTTCLQLLQAQAQHSKLKLDYLRRREEREEKESSARREMERIRSEREQADWEHNKESITIKQRAQLATDLLSNPVVDGSVRQAAVEYLKKLFD